MNLRMAVVGCGAISHWHLDAIDRAKVPITVTVAVDPDEANARRVADRTGATPYASLAAALSSRNFDAALKGNRYATRATITATRYVVVLCGLATQSPARCFRSLRSRILQRRSHGAHPRASSLGWKHNGPGALHRARCVQPVTVRCTSARRRRWPGQPPRHR